MSINPNDIPPHIRNMNVSYIWQKRFTLIEKAGGLSLSHIKDLTRFEQASIYFNVFTFLFGPFYLLLKGLWRDAFWYFLIAVLFSQWLLMLGPNVNAALLPGFSLFLAGLMSARTNLNYYKKMLQKQGSHTP